MAALLAYSADRQLPKLPRVDVTLLCSFNLTPDIGSKGTMKLMKSATLAFLVAAILAQPVSVAEIPQQRTVMDQKGIIVQKGEKSASIIFSRTAIGITEIGVERLDSFPDAYVTLVTASGPTREDAAIVGATIQTFTNLNQQSSFTDTNSITFAYNRLKPGYVISELERAKLISPAEARTARAALDSLRTRIDSTPVPVKSN
jgi:hypothetical protein